MVKIPEKKKKNEIKTSWSRKVQFKQKVWIFILFSHPKRMLSSPLFFIFSFLLYSCSFFLPFQPSLAVPHRMDIPNSCSDLIFISRRQHIQHEEKECFTPILRVVGWLFSFSFLLTRRRKSKMTVWEISSRSSRISSGSFALFSFLCVPRPPPDLSLFLPLFHAILLCCSFDSQLQSEIPSYLF